jgi:hypothetical protein
MRSKTRQLAEYLTNLARCPLGLDQARTELNMSLDRTLMELGANED